MDRVILQWNLPNWITVFLMATIGITVVNTVLAFINSKAAQ
jgi:hypothetical protein